MRQERSVYAKFAIGVAGAAAMLVISPASATQGDTAPETPTLQVDVPDLSGNDRIICQRMPPPAGSRIGSRNICKTQAQWAQLERERRQQTDRLSIRAQANNSE